MTPAYRDVLAAARGRDGSAGACRGAGNGRPLVGPLPAAVADGERSLRALSRRAAAASALSLCSSARISQGRRESKEAA